MDMSQIVNSIDTLFKGTGRKIYSDESGVTHQADKAVRKLGYCVNLTLETIEEARSHGVDMMVTHHKAWDEVFGLEEACLEKLAAYEISHYFNHLPLDDCDFGTNDSLLKKLNIPMVKRTLPWKGLYFGRIGEYDEAIAFDALVKDVENLLQVPVRWWRFHDKKVKRVGLVCGNGAPTACLKEAVENNCDAYMTGESDLYTIQYAKLKGINLIVGSHTLTEFFGIESLALKLKEKMKDLEVINLQEDHYEAHHEGHR